MNSWKNIKLFIIKMVFLVVMYIPMSYIFKFVLLEKIYRNLFICFIALYVISNSIIFPILKRRRFVFILNIFDSLLIFLSTCIGIYFVILAKRNPGEAGFVVIFFLPLLIAICIGIGGIHINRSK